MTSAPIALPFSDRILWLLSLSILLVILVGLALALTALVLRYQNNRTARAWAVREALWDPVILNVLAGDQTAEHLLELVRPGDERHFVAYLMRFCRRLRGAERKVLSRLAGPYLPGVAQDLHHRRVERRALAAQTLGELGGSQYRPHLAEALDDPAPLVVVIAVGALAQHYDATHVQRVLASVSRLELWTVRYLVSMLQRMGPESAWAFREVLADPSQGHRLRTIAANVLAVFNDVPAADLAATALTTSDNVDLQVAALRLLDRVGGPEHVAAVREVLGAPEAAVRGNAVRVLASLGGESELPAIRAALEDGSHWVAIHAVRSLKRLGETDLMRNLVARGHRRSSAIREVLPPGPE